MTGKIVFCLLFVLFIIMPAIGQAPSGGKSFEEYVAALGGNDSKARINAAWELGKIADPRAADPLIILLGDEDSVVRDWAMMALVKIGQPSVNPLLNALGNKNSNTRWQAAAALGLINDTSAIDPLIYSMKNDNNSDVRYWSMVSLGLIADSKAIDPLAGALRDNNSSIRLGSARILARMNPEGLTGLLIMVLQDGDNGSRKDAAMMLGNVRDDRVVGALIQSLGDKNNDVREVSAESLARFGETIINPLIQTIYDKGSSNEMRSGAARALGLINDTRAIDPLSSELSDNSSIVRRTASIALAKLDRAKAIAFLTPMLNDSSKDKRIDAAWALGEIQDNRANMPLLQLLGRDKDTSVGLVAAQALRKIADKS